MSLESVDLVKREVPRAERLDAFHDVEQPAARLRRFVSEEKRLLPFREHQVLCANDAGLNDMNLAGLRDAAEQDIGPDPARAPRGGSQWLSFLDDLANEKVLWDDEQIDDRKRLEIVFHEEQVRIVACSEPLAFRLEGAIDNPRAEFALLTLEFELLATGGAKEVCKRAIVGEG